MIFGQNYKMLYKSSNRSYSHNFIFWIILTFSLTLLFQRVNGQAQCGKRPFPSKIPLDPNENIIVNLDNYFDGNNLTFSVIPNNNFSSLQPAYQCKTLGSERTGSIIKTRYLKTESREILAALTNSPYSEGVFSLYLYHLNKLKISSYNIPKEDVASCNEFDFQIINSTHFSATVDCRYTKKLVTRALLRGLGSFDSAYIDWTLNIAPLYAYSNIVTRLQMTEEILLRGVFSATNSYIEVWSWSGEVRQLQMVLDKTFLNKNRFNGKAMKLYGKLLLVLDYQQGLILIKLLPTNFLSVVGIVQSPFHDDFEYNPITGVLQLMKKGKIISMLLNPSTLELSSTGQSYNIYKYEDIRGVITTDSTVIALGATAVNIFRKISSVSQTRHSSVFFVPGVKNIYSRSIENGVTMLMVQNINSNLQLSSCSVRPPFLKLSVPLQSFLATVTATSVIEGQHSTCSQNFTVSLRAGSEDVIYDNGYQLDDEVIYANPEGFGIIQLSKYGVGRKLAYSFKTISQTILKKETRVHKSQRSNCSFENRLFGSGTNFRFVESWENIVVIQFTAENILRYYFCSSLNCKYSIDYYRIQPIVKIAHETIRKIKNLTQIFQALLQENQRTSSIIIRQISTDLGSGELNIQQVCFISYIGVGQYWNVSQLQISNGQLYVVLGARKQIRIYDLHQKGCPNILNLNIRTCPWGYFAPQSIHFNKASKSVLPSQTFIIRQWDQLLTVRIYKDESLTPILVARNKLPLIVNYTLIYTDPYLVTFDILTNRSMIFYFDDKGNIQFLRELLLDSRRFRISDSSKYNFFKLIDPRHLVIELEGVTGQNYSVALFKIDQLISPASEYLNYPLKIDERATWIWAQGAWQMLRLSLMSSPTLSTLLCSANTTYLQPTLQLFFGRLASYVQEYSQNVTLIVSSSLQVKQHDFKVTLSNAGDSIKRGRNFPSRQYKIYAKSEFAIADNKWFLGSIFDYEFDCLECQKRIEFKQKIQLESTSTLQTPSNFFWQEHNGKTIKILMGSFLVQSHQNQSFWPIASEGTDNFQLLSGTLLTTSGGQCLNAVSSRRGNEIIALCQRTYPDGQQLHYLTLISTVSYRHFVIAETMLDIPLSEIPKLLVKNDLIIIYSESVAYLYTLWLVEQGLTFINLDVIDREDIDGTICSLDISYNDTVQHSPINQILYSLVVTQCSSSIYFTSFLVYIQKQQYIDEDGEKKISQVPNLHTSSAQLINLISRLRQNHIQIPTQANIIQTITNRIPGDRISIISVFDRFHTYEFIVQLSRSGVAFNISIDKIFYKYGDYEAVSVNIADFLAIKYKSRLLGREERYALFDHKGQPDGRENGIDEYFSFSAYSFQNNAGTNEVPWSMRNTSIIQLQSDRIESISINNTLRGSIKNFQTDVLYTQKLQITANNLDSARTAVIIIKSIDKFQLQGWQIFLIVLGAIIFVILTIFGLRYSIRKFRKVRKMIPLVQDARLQQSLLSLQEEERASANLSIIRREEPQKQK